MAKSVSYAVSSRETNIIHRAVRPEGWYWWRLIRHMIWIVPCFIHFIIYLNRRVYRVFIISYFSNSCSIFTLLIPCEKKSIINVWISLFSVADWSITQLCLNPWVRWEFHATFPVKMLRFAKCHCINKIV
jgi:hypothetical protein